jgi:chromate transport protein ChrA
MFAFYNKCKNYFEYVPVALLALLFVAETEMKNKAASMSCQLGITIITAIIFFVLLMKFKIKKYYAFAAAALIWIALVYAKRCHLLPPIL